MLAFKGHQVIRYERQSITDDNHAFILETATWPTNQNGWLEWKCKLVNIITNLREVAAE